MHVLQWVEIGNTHIIYSDGRVWSRPKNKYLKPHKTAAGYYRIKIGAVNHLLHRLVAIHFIPNPENKPEVNHKDGNKLNYSLDNLEWATPSENVMHSYRTGLQSKAGVKNVKAILDDDQVRSIRSSTISREHLALMYCVSKNTIHDILARRTWKHVN